MDFTAILNFTKKAAKSLTVGVVGAVQSGENTKIVPAYSSIPINEEYVIWTSKSYTTGSKRD